jgi:hypothetical protein
MYQNVLNVSKCFEMYQNVKSIESLERLERLERLDSLLSLKSFKSLYSLSLVRVSIVNSLSVESLGKLISISSDTNCFAKTSEPRFLTDFKNLNIFLKVSVVVSTGIFKQLVLTMF